MNTSTLTLPHFGVALSTEFTKAIASMRNNAFSFAPKVFEEMKTIAEALIVVIATDTTLKISLDRLERNDEPDIQALLAGQYYVILMAWCCAYVNQGSTIEGAWKNFSANQLEKRTQWKGGRINNPILFEYIYRAVHRHKFGPVPSNVTGFIHQFIRDHKAIELQNPKLRNVIYTDLCSLTGFKAPPEQPLFLTPRLGIEKDEVFMAEWKRMFGE